MFKPTIYKPLILSKIMLNIRTSYSQRPLFDTSATFRAKPEDVPKGIWEEDKESKYTSVEEVKGRWHYVERLFPKLRVPEPINTVSSFGWKTPAENIPDLPYYVKRTRNHMLPVYETRIFKDKILITRVAYVNGDIWVFEHDLKTYLEEKLGQKLEMHVNEIACKVNIRGNHVDIVKEWLYNKGF